jgi:hypothetical protein
MSSKIVYMSSFALGVLFLVASIWIFFVVALTDPLTSMSGGQSPVAALHAPAITGFT